MNNREKMLADLREFCERASSWEFNQRGRSAADEALIHEAFTLIIEKHGPTFKALLTDPTLEEVLAELAEYGHPQIWKDGGGWMCSIFKPSNNGFTQDHATPLQAARECLRRVKE